ncbi:MAG: uracil-DNA glycosylase [Ramlibacter sp.]|nr:uracil-DNA glycosylase [Ramlibacter sp.]
MSLDLDSRRRAMLAEMGLKLFEPPGVPGGDEAASHEPARPAGLKPATGGAVHVPAPMSIAREAAPESVSSRPGVGLMGWDALEQAVAACRACRLCEGRRNAVFGVGDRQADWLIVGEAPGENEDLQGEPFVGQDGKLLDNMLKALGLDRHHKVYIANALKCRPPGNRNPEPQEVALCEPFLRRQVELLQPKIILAMGRFAVQSLLGSADPIGKLRGRAHQYMGVPVIVTFHPAYLLRNLPDKAKAWADLCLAQEVMRAQPAAGAPAGR